MILGANATEVVSGAGGILEGSSIHGPVVYLAVFFTLVTLGFMVLVGVFVHFIFLKPYNERETKRQEQQQKESEQRISTMERQSKTMEGIGKSLEQILDLTIHQKEIHEKVTDMVKALVEESKVLVEMHKNPKTPFAVINLERNVLLVMQIADWMIQDVDQIELDPVLKSDLNKAINMTQKRIEEFS